MTYPFRSTFLSQPIEGIIPNPHRKAISHQTRRADEPAIADTPMAFAPFRTADTGNRQTRTQVERSE